MVEFFSKLTKIGILSSISIRRFNYLTSVSDKNFGRGSLITSMASSLLLKQCTLRWEWEFYRIRIYSCWI